MLDVRKCAGQNKRMNHTIEKGTYGDRYVLGTASVERSTSNQWFVRGQRSPSCPAYVAPRLQDALNLARTVNHWNATGVVLAFNINDDLPAWL